MKLLTIKTEDGQLDYMVKLENEEEMGYCEDGNAEWDSILFSEFEITDDDVAYYFGANEQGPGVGETFELDGIKWEIVA